MPFIMEPRRFFKATFGSRKRTTAGKRAVLHARTSCSLCKVSTKIKSATSMNISTTGNPSKNSTDRATVSTGGSEIFEFQAHQRRTNPKRPSDRPHRLAACPESAHLAEVHVGGGTPEPRTLRPRSSQTSLRALRNTNSLLSGNGGEHANDRITESAQRVDVLLGVTLEFHARVGKAAQVGERLVRSLAGKEQNTSRCQIAAAQ